MALATPAPLAASRRCAVAVRCSKEAPTRRAILVGGLAAAVGLGFFAAVPRRVLATDYKEALKRKEARKAQLREAAGAIKATGKDQQVFKKSAYSMPDDAHTPNVHTRQNEGARTQENV